MTAYPLQCVLFDLDGTLVDTAPDLIACLNHTLQVFGQPPVVAEMIRPFISYGAMVMIEHSLQNADKLDKSAMLQYMLDYYQQNIAVHSRLFDGMDVVLQQLEQAGLKWGVVTNKHQRFSLPLLAALQLDQRAACIVSGDSTPFSKPHPEPMFAACRQVGVAPEACLYLGDAAHDMAAGRQAGMRVVTALYGYLKQDDTPESWGADALISHPEHLLQWIQN